LLARVGVVRQLAVEDVADAVLDNNVCEAERV